MTNRYQIVILYLSDGTTAKFTGPAQIDETKEISIIKSQIITARELPSGYKFEEITEDKPCP